MNLFLQKVITDDGVTYNITKGGYFLGIVLILIALLVVSYFTNKDDKAKMSVKQLTFSAICLAIAFVLSNIKLFKLPMGGSVTIISMFFVTYIGYLYGPRVGLSAAISYGFLQLLVDPYIISIPQLFCDYILAFGALGLSGFFYNKKHGMTIGYIVGVFGRFVFAVLSGVIFFSAYAEGSGHTPLVYSILYNGSYLSVELAMTLVIIAIPAVHKALNYVKQAANEKTLKNQVSLG